MKQYFRNTSIATLFKTKRTCAVLPNKVEHLLKQQGGNNMGSIYSKSIPHAKKHVSYLATDMRMDDLHYRLIFDLGKSIDTPGKNLLKVVKSQNLVAKCCKIRNIPSFYIFYNTDRI